MSDPERLLDGNQAPRALIEGLRQMPRPTPASAETRAALTAHFSSLAGISSGAGGAIVAPWVKIALVSGAVLVGGGLFVGLRHHSSDAARPVGGLAGESVKGSAVDPGPAGATPVAGASDAPGTAAPGEPTSITDTAGPGRARPAAAHQAASDHLAPAAPEPRDTLAQEEALLERARQNVNDAPAEALKRLAEHQRRFPAGQLTPERMYLSAAAHSRLGQVAQARKQAELLHQQYPTSVYARQVDALVAARSTTP